MFLFLHGARYSIHVHTVIAQYMTQVPRRTHPTRHVLNTYGACKVQHRHKHQTYLEYRHNCFSSPPTRPRQGQCQRQERGPHTQDQDAHMDSHGHTEHRVAQKQTRTWRCTLKSEYKPPPLPCSIPFTNLTTVQPKPICTYLYNAHTRQNHHRFTNHPTRANTHNIQFPPSCPSPTDFSSLAHPITHPNILIGSPLLAP